MLHWLAYKLLGWPHVTEEERRSAKRALLSPKCVCGHPKWSGHPFCHECTPKARVKTVELRRRFVLDYNKARKKLQPPVPPMGA